MTKAQKNNFQKQNPKNQVITKTDFAKYRMTWLENPHLVSKGAQKNFIKFADVIGEEWEKDNLQFNALAALFDTDSYQCRIYIYERQLQHEFYFPTYYGHGCRFSMQARIDLSSHLRLAARLGYTNYFDRNTIGSDLQQINHSHQTDLDLQLRWKF